MFFKNKISPKKAQETILSAQKKADQDIHKLSFQIKKLAKERERLIDKAVSPGADEADIAMELKTNKTEAAILLKDKSKKFAIKCASKISLRKLDQYQTDKAIGAFSTLLSSEQFDEMLSTSDINEDLLSEKIEEMLDRELSGFEKENAIDKATLNSEVEAIQGLKKAIEDGNVEEAESYKKRLVNVE